MHEIFAGKSIVLLVGGLLIGWAAGPDGITSLEPFFFDLFKGVLALFLLEMGLIAASQARTLRESGLLLALFGILVPVPMATVGALVGWGIGLSVGGTTLLAVLALVILGGQVIRDFSLALVWGVIIGTYSSVCLAVPILLYDLLRERWAGGLGDAFGPRSLPLSARVRPRQLPNQPVWRA